MPDVWDLTKKAQGDHVLIALTIDECKALIQCVNMAERTPGFAYMGEIAGREEIRRSLRDQKDIDA